MIDVSEAIAAGTIGERLWFYANYHCNLTCGYCLTESAPTAKRRLLDAATMARIAGEAVELGFRSFGITGGEPFMRADIVDVTLALAERLPVVLLTNLTLVRGRILEDVRRFAGARVTIQTSLDSAKPDENDEMRGAENFAKVVETIPRLRELGIPVRIATTGGTKDPEQAAELCSLHRSLGIDDADHIVRPIISRGRAAGAGVEATVADIPPELTLTADGSFWSPFAPTVRGGKLDTDLLLTRTITPLAVAADAMIRFTSGAPLATSNLGIV